MEIYIDNNSNEPAYLQLYKKIVKDIVTDVYFYGSKLPSKRTIAADSGVSVITVEHAFSLLCEEGYVESRQRSGYYVIYIKDDFLNVAEAVPYIFKESDLESDEKVADINQSAADSTISYSLVSKTMRRVIADYGERILVKSPNHGCNELRTEICAYLSRSRGIHVKPSQVIIGSGAEYLYGLLVQLLGTENVYAIESPCYEKIEKVYRMMGVDLEKLKLSDDGIMSEELASSKAKYLHVTPFHSYPSGITASISKKHEYLRWIENRNGILIEDNYDSELTVSMKPEETLFSMSDNGKVIYINTFTKTIAPSVRLGYMILPEHMEKEFNEKLGFYSCTVPVFDQYVVAELIKNGDFERHINRVRRQKRKNKSW